MAVNNQVLKRIAMVTGKPAPTIAEAVLRAIGEAPYGLRLSEIQRVAWEHSKPLEPFDRRKHRGWWCTNLLGSNGEPGLLEMFCMKDTHGRWRLCEEIERPFFRRSPNARLTKTYRANGRARHAAQLLRASQSVKCPGCERPHWGDMLTKTPDKQAHVVVHSREYTTDCRGRVWSASRQLSQVTLRELEVFAAQAFRNYDVRHESILKFVEDGVAKPEPVRATRWALLEIDVDPDNAN